MPRSRLDEIEGGFDAVITMGCGKLPVGAGQVSRGLGIARSQAMDDDGYRAVRDEIARRVKMLAAL